MTREIELRDLDKIEMGKRVRQLRQNKKMSREDLAGKLSVSSKFIADIEYGDKGISINKFYHLIQILQVSADYLLAGEIEGEQETEIKRRLEENILEPLKGCSIEQLKCMEQIAKYYVEGMDKGKIK